MKKNMAFYDRIIRLLLSLIVLSLYVGEVISGPIAIAALIVVAILSLTAFVGVCPLYSLFENIDEKENPKA